MCAHEPVHSSEPGWGDESEETGREDDAVPVLEEEECSSVVAVECVGQPSPGNSFCNMLASPSSGYNIVLSKASNCPFGEVIADLDGPPVEVPSSCNEERDDAAVEGYAKVGSPSAESTWCASGRALGTASKHAAMAL